MKGKSIYSSTVKGDEERRPKWEIEIQKERETETASGNNSLDFGNNKSEGNK